jgi:hypothetical protein
MLRPYKCTPFKRPGWWAEQEADFFSFGWHLVELLHRRERG